MSGPSLPGLALVRDPPDDARKDGDYMFIRRSASTEPLAC